MKLTYREDPKEWRKSIWLTALGLAILSSLLRWRRHLPANAWLGLLLALGLVALAALVQPRWFRDWYRLSLWLGFHSSQFVGRCVLVLRLTGKDPLRLRRPRQTATYWNKARESNPLDRLF
jgi:hypothetical protein